ncbi:MAG TPA: hypothetical protein VJC03_05190, partial [bacterium]|nr:hypothetical protein [bacterium]
MKARAAETAALQELRHAALSGDVSARRNAIEKLLDLGTEESGSALLDVFRNNQNADFNRPFMLNQLAARAREASYGTAQLLLGIVRLSADKNGLRRTAVRVLGELEGLSTEEFERLSGEMEKSGLSVEIMSELSEGLAYLYENVEKRRLLSSEQELNGFLSRFSVEESERIVRETRGMLMGELAGRTDRYSVLVTNVLAVLTVIQSEKKYFTEKQFRKLSKAVIENAGFTDKNDYVATDGFTFSIPRLKELGQDMRSLFVVAAHEAMHNAVYNIGETQDKAIDEFMAFLGAYDFGRQRDMDDTVAGAIAKVYERIEHLSKDRSEAYLVKDHKKAMAGIESLNEKMESLGYSRQAKDY